MCLYVYIWDPISSEEGVRSLGTGVKGSCVWILGTELETSGRAVHLPNCLEVSPAQVSVLYYEV